MRIALVIYGDLNQNSGGYLYDRYLVDFLRKQKHHIDMVSLPRRNYVAHLADNHSPDLSEQIRILGPDVVLQDELNHPSLISLNRKIKGEIPIVSIVHHLRSSEPRSALMNAVYRNVEKRYLETVDGFVFNSFTTKKVVTELLGGSKPNVVARPGGNRLKPKLTSAQVRRRAKLPCPLRIAFLGNLIRRKAPHLLIESLARHPRGSYHISFAGSEDVEPAYCVWLRKLAIRHRVESEVEFRGHLAQSELVRLLESSHVLAVPSSYEGYGIAYIEGMGFGLPAIGTRAGAASEIIADGRNGYLIVPDDVEALKSRLEYLNSNRDVLLKMSFEALKHFESHPTWAKSMRRVREFLSSYNSNSIHSPSSRRKS
ncbi:MAG: glycosyltransferase family 4 protein [Anaerolineales bacterium]